MKAILLTSSDQAWSDFLGGVRHDFYHLPAFVELEANRLAGKAVALHVVDGPRELLLPLVVRPIDGSGVDGTSPYGYPGPLVKGGDDQAFVGAALEGALPMLRAEGFVSLFVRFHPILSPAPPGALGTAVLHGDTVAIDLTVPEMDYWMAVRRTHRRNIDEAIKSGYSVRFEDGRAHLAMFKDLYRATMRRVGATPEYFYDDRYFDGLVEALGDRLHMAVMGAGGVVAAAAMLVETGDIVEYHLVGVDEGLAHLAPAKLIVDMARGWARERGDALLHLGGGVGGANDSLFHYKAGFSSLRFPFSTLRIVVDPVEYDRLARERSPGYDSSDASGFFPLYRQTLPNRRDRAGEASVHT